MRAMILVLGTMILSPYTYANDIVGNGGDAVVCPTSVRMLDLYEGQTIRNIQPDTSLISEGREDAVQNVKATVKNVIDRLRNIDPHRADKYQKQAEEFWTETAFVPDASLVDVPDSQHVAVPHGCTIEQVAIQQSPQFAKDPRYIIAKSLWDRMETFDRASLILHEIIYREALSKGQENSVRARYFNSLLSSMDMRSIDGSTYRRAVYETGFPLALLMNGVTLNGKPIFVYRGGCYRIGMNDVMFQDREIQNLFYPAITASLNFWWPEENYIDIGLDFNDRYSENMLYRFHKGWLEDLHKGGNSENTNYRVCQKN